MVTNQEQQHRALAPSLAGVASYPSTRSLVGRPTRVAQRLASSAADHQSPIASHRSRVPAPSTQPGTPRWTHPLVSQWKHSSRVEPARNSIPAPSTVPGGQTCREQSRACASDVLSRTTNHESRITDFSCHLFSKFSDNRLTSITYHVECKFVCSPSCRPGKYQLFDNQMNQARTRLVCP